MTPAYADRVWTPTPETLTAPLRWKKPGRVLVGGDLFNSGLTDAYIDCVFARMALCQRSVFLVPTDGPERLRDYLSNAERHDRVDYACRAEGLGAIANELWPLPNVIPAVRCSNQPEADARIPLLLQAPAAKRFVSLEPLLGPVNLHPYLHRTAAPGICTDIDGGWYHDPGDPRCSRCRPRLDWVIVGGESGPMARPCYIAWIRSIVQQCKAADVSVLVKQLGSSAQDEDGSMHGRYSAGGIRHDFPKLLDRKGADPSEWPNDLRDAREVPR